MSQSVPGLAHLVFFTLKDHSAASRESFLAACRKYLTDHPGTVHFSVGLHEPSYQRPVNDQDFDVSLVVVFDSNGNRTTATRKPRGTRNSSRNSRRTGRRCSVRRHGVNAESIGDWTGSQDFLGSTGL